MRRLIYFTTLVVALLSMQGCGDNSKFTVTGHVAGNPSMNLYTRYYSNNRLTMGVTVVNEGNFEFAGNAPEPTLVEVMDNERKVIGRLYIANGDNATMEINRANPLLSTAESKKEEMNKRLSDVVSANADVLADGAKGNEFIEQYVAEHPGDMVGALMFLSFYNYKVDPVRAYDFALGLPADMRQGGLFDQFFTRMSLMGDSTVYAPIDSLIYRPYHSRDPKAFVASDGTALIALTNDRSNRSDSVVPRLKKLAENKKVRILDLALVQDTGTWKRITRRDTATWIQGWAPGGIYARGIDRLGVPGLPYYIVIDAEGRQRYRGADLTAASDSAVAVAH